MTDYITNNLIAIAILLLIVAIIEAGVTALLTGIFRQLICNGVYRTYCSWTEMPGICRKILVSKKLFRE